MTDLHVIAELFAVLDGRERYERTLAEWVVARAEVKRRTARESHKPRHGQYKHTKAWRLANPEKARALAARTGKTYRTKHPEKRTAAKQRWRRKYPDKARAQWRRNTAAYRARKSAAQGAAA